MSDPEELFEQAVAADEEDRVVEALALFERAVEALMAERVTRAPNDRRLMLELDARDRLFSAGFEPVPPRFAERAREQVGLWDAALARFGAAAVGASCGRSLVSLGRTALLAGDDELAIEVRSRIRPLVEAGPPGRLPDDELAAVSTYVEARTFDADVDHHLGRSLDAAATLLEVVELLRERGGFPSTELSTCERTLREANLVGRYVRLRLDGGDTGDVPVWLDRYLALLEATHAEAVTEDDEFVDAATIRSLEDAAELAARSGHPDVRARAVRWLSVWTAELAERDSVYGHILYGELPETLARVESFEP